MDDMIFSFKVETPPAWIPIGRTAENDWRTIEIDCSYWFNMDASGNVVLMYRPNCGMAPYPLLIERDGDNIVWHPKSGELVEGVGQMQAFFYVGESKIGSSEMVSCEVDGSLLGGDTGTDPGAVAPPWAIDIIEQIAVLSGHYPKIIDGDLFVWDSEIEDWVQFEGGSSDAVLYTEQALTDAQKAQARSNIDAAKLFVVRIASESDPLTANKTFAETYAATQNGMLVRADLWDMDDDLWLDCIHSDSTQIIFGGGAFGAQMTLIFGSDESLTRTISQIPTALSELSSDDTHRTVTDEEKLAWNGKADKSEIPSLTGYATETWVQNQGYQTAQDVQTAIAGVRQLPTVTASDNGKFLRVADGAWTAEVGDEHDAYSALPSDTASGAIASFPDGADDVPVKSLVAQIVPVQSGSGDPSPDNIRPITGFTGCKVSRTGKNLLSCGMAHGIWSGGVFYSHEGTSTRYLASSAKIPVAGGATYTVSLTNDPTNAWALSNVNFFAQGVFVDYLVVIKTSTFTVPEGIDEIGISGLLKTAITNTSDVNPTDIQLEVGSAATAYEPYQGDTYNIAFPSEAGTVYGGTLDVANGVLTVDMAIVDMGTLDWMYYPNQQRMVAQVNSAKLAMANVGLDGACSVYKVINTGYQSAPDKSIVISNNFIPNQYAAMVVHDEDYTDAATFKTAVSGQTLVFPIKNPVTYQLDPVTVTTLLGVNNIWADTGDIAVDYRADTGLYIQKLTGSTEEDMIADAPIASGKYFLVGNTLYLSTAAIAAGATLTPGTNCVKTNLAEALNALNS